MATLTKTCTCSSDGNFN